MIALVRTSFEGYRIVTGVVVVPVKVEYEVIASSGEVIGVLAHCARQDAGVLAPRKVASSPCAYRAIVISRFARL